MMRNLITILVLSFVLLNCKSPEARRPVSSKSGSFIDQSVERNKKLIAKEEEVLEKIIAEDPSNEYISSQNGFWYYYNLKVEDSLIKPDFGDIVNFEYDVKTWNGDIIYSKDELRNQSYVMDKEEIFTGLREGLKLMKAGETVTFYFPSQKAYGYYGDENRIGMNVPLLCEVTVNSVVDN